MFPGLIELSVTAITTSLKVLEIDIDKWMVYRIRGSVCGKIFFCNIGFMYGIMHQHSVPGFVFWWPAQRNLFIPFVVVLKNRINIDDYAAVIEESVLDHLADIETGFGSAHDIRVYNTVVKASWNRCYHNKFEHKLSTMREARIFVDCDLQEDSELTLRADTSHYVATVLRRKVGHRIILFNGSGSDYPASILSISKKEVQVQIASAIQTRTESALQITLLQGISRAQHMDYTLQKAVELGVYRIVPVFTEFGNLRIDDARAQKKWQHWQKIIISACEQSGRSCIPELAAPQALSTALAAESNTTRVILHPGVGLSLRTMTAPADSISLLAGPEGGFSEAELAQAEAQQFQPVVLGPRVLRTETAALAALSICQSLWGDMA